jgi:2-keto-4-pentenoate hydratase
VAEVSVEVATALRRHIPVPPAGERLGWKLAYGLGSLPPLVGPLGRRLPDGASFEAGTVGDLRVDTEVALLVGDRLNIAGLAVALEVVDVAESDAPLDRAIASGLTHLAVAIGSRCSVTTTLGHARGIVDGKLRRKCEVAVDPDRSLSLAADLLHAAGLALMPGDWLITGSQTQIRVAPGNRVGAEIDGLGRVDVLIT